MGTPVFRLLPATLHPPALSADDSTADETSLPWALLELESYVADRKNATTAYSKTWDGREIQVTFCLRRPPHLSYLCVYSADAKIPVEPLVLATEDDLVLLRIAVRNSQEDVMGNIDYYIYQANNGLGQPSLQRLPRPPCRRSFDATDIGIMRCHIKSRFFLHHHRSDNKDDNKSYIVAGLVRDDQYKDFILYLWDSERNTWTTSPVELNHQQKHQYGGEFLHRNSKVIAIGGDAGTMAFVDLWRGILFCNVLPAAQGKTVPPLCYVPLPGRRNSFADARNSRDIALIKGRIKYVELKFYIKKSKVLRGYHLNDGWIASTYSRDATNIDDTWHKDYEVDSNLINLEGNPYLELLPKVLNDEDMPLQPFKRLDVCRPTLSLRDDETAVYIMAKVNHADNVAWVISVDMKDNSVVGVSQFAAERTTCCTVTYIHSRISKYLKKDRGNFLYFT